MIAGKDDDRHAPGTGTVGVLQTRKLDRKHLQPAKGAGGLGEFALPDKGRVAMDGRGARTFFGDPLGQHVLSAFDIVAQGDLRLRM
jgi:hypothetical protein